MSAGSVIRHRCNLEIYSQGSASGRQRNEMFNLAVFILLGEVTKSISTIQTAVLNPFEMNTYEFNIVSYVPQSSETTIRNGDNLEFWCNADDDWEWCTFSHVPSGRFCDLQWKKPEWNVTVNNCTSFEGRFENLGGYEDYKCGIRINDMSCEDSGEWRCDLRMYDYADTKRVTGSKASKTFHIQISGHCLNVGNAMIGLTAALLLTAILGSCCCLKRTRNSNVFLCFKKTSSHRNENDDVTNTNTNQSQV